MTMEIIEQGIPNVSSGQIDKISAALAKTQGDIKDVYKEHTGSVEGTSKTGKSYKYDYKYAGLDAVMDAIREVASVNGLALIQRPNGNSLHSILTHASGQWIDYGLYPLGNADKHQERGSALTYARRYVTCCVYGVAPAADEDDGKGGNEALGKKPVYQEPPPEYRPSDPVRPHKDAYVIPCPIKVDGTLDFDAFAAELEGKVISARDSQELSLWNRANAKTLTAMQKERPDLFNAIGEEFKKMAAALA